MTFYSTLQSWILIRPVSAISPPYLSAVTQCQNWYVQQHCQVWNKSVNTLTTKRCSFYNKSDIVLRNRLMMRKRTVDYYRLWLDKRYLLHVLDNINNWDFLLLRHQWLRSHQACKNRRLIAWIRDAVLCQLSLRVSVQACVEYHRKYELNCLLSSTMENMINISRIFVIVDF